MDISPVNENNAEKVKFYKKKWFKIALSIFLVLLIAGCAVGFKTGYIVNKMSTTGGFFESIARSIPGVGNELKGESEGRINIALLGMRGEGIEGGGLLADTIMVVSIKPQENKVSIVSVPRDLYVTVPGTGSQQKINAVYHNGEENKKGKGIEDMKTILGEISGQSMHYGVSINFDGFKQLVDAVGGVEISLDEPFSEPLQFNEPHECDENVFTEATGEMGEKQVLTSIKKTGERNYKTVIIPLCTNPDKECGGAFSLPSGNQVLNGDTALCYVRSRVTSNDFERARRQQQVLQALKNSLTSRGTLTDFNKVNGILDALGNNVRTDMKAWEMKKIFEVYQGITDPQITQKVLENSEEGLLYHPEETTPQQGYILLPRGNNYDKIKELFQNII